MISLTTKVVLKVRKMFLLLFFKMLPDAEVFLKA